MTDREIVQEVRERQLALFRRDATLTVNFNWDKVLVRYARLIERAKCNKQIEIERNRVLKEVGGIGED